MASTPPLRSPSLEPPRKSVELEDPGAHNLETSSDDEFSDAKEAITSPTRPTTRVERVDTEPAHGEVPGTVAYNQRTEDAQPDQIAVISNSDRMGASSAKSRDENTAGEDLPGGSPQIPVPRTVITRVDSQPAHGEVPGTAAYAQRSQDARPDEVERKGDVPSKSAHRLMLVDSHARSPSPIAADGGFGPMESEDDEDDDEDRTPMAEPTQAEAESTVDAIAEEDGFGNDLGNDFDEFADGEEAEDDFGDFDDGFQAADEPRPAPLPQEPISPAKSLYPVLDFSSQSLPEIEEMIKPHLGALFPSAKAAQSAEAPTPLPDTNSAFLSERSYSLWQQLIAPPPLQPPNWVRSRIRRLFLVSLGVPVDLDEILPKSKQKKLILSYTPTEQTAKPGTKPKDGKATVANAEQPTKRTRGPPPPPDFDIVEVKKLSRMTDADLEELDGAALQAHVKELERLAEQGKEVLQYWVKRKEMAVDEKEAFDSVVESLVRHARRVRK